jgi:hypothetical protein
MESSGKFDNSPDEAFSAKHSTLIPTESLAFIPAIFFFYRN